MSNEIEIEVGGKESITPEFKKVNKEAGDVEVTVSKSFKGASSAMESTEKTGSKLGKGFESLGGSAGRMAGIMGDTGNAIDALNNANNAGKERAQRHAQALVDEEQAANDLRQASRDTTQALLDMNQAQIDGKQAAIDAEQAQADLNQATIDAEQAQKDYDTAVTEHGKNSIEAKQALQDLNQAHIDAKQAQEDLTQAQQDGNQASEDGRQANEDYAQSQTDAKQARIDLTQAERDANPPDNQKWIDQLNTYAPLVMSVAAGTELLSSANNVLSLSFLKNAASQVAAKTATMASAAASGVATAAQWAWNVAMDANPIGLIIIAIGALVAAIIWIATKTTWFQDIWHAVWGAIGDPVKAFASWVGGYIGDMFHGLVASAIWWKDMFVSVIRWIIDALVWFNNMVNSIVSRVGDAFGWLGDRIAGIFKWAFNMIAWAWNNTAGRLNFSIPSWVPGIGGNSFGLPKLPMLDTGGDILKTGAAIVHKGERVLNRQEAARYNAVQTAQAMSGVDVSGKVEFELKPAPGADEPLMRSIIQGLSVKVRTSGGSVDKLFATSGVTT